MSRTAEDELFALLEGAGVGPAIRAQLSRFAALALEANRRVNLTGAKSPAALTQHVLDSLTVVPHVREPYVDVGSGAGLPGIPVAIAAGIPVTLIEATAKKAAFLAKTLEELEVEGRVIQRRAEDVGQDDAFRERFASGTARALSGVTTVAELLLPLIAPGGVAVLQRGRFDERERRSLEDASLMLGGRIESELALEGERRILLLRKERPTPLRFPRRPGIPEKRPLCT
ncbi:MAG TPA: 16S rRNA (guanine(527)-N(7))-methyltransferase RsmG [Candidatus Binatia bacterium]|nr:16S rRNA (guanine(527)-N(7))-methyltransferase RsmG [Candidatus Binatia bacterium]